MDFEDAERRREKVKPQDPHATTACGAPVSDKKKRRTAQDPLLVRKNGAPSACFKSLLEKAGKDAGATTKAKKAKERVFYYGGLQVQPAPDAVPLRENAIA